MPQIKKIHLSFTANISRSLPVVCYYSGLLYHSCRTKPSDAERERCRLRKSSTPRRGDPGKLWKPLLTQFAAQGLLGVPGVMDFGGGTAPFWLTQP